MGGLAWGTRAEACGGGEAKGHRLRPLIAPQGSGAGTAGDFFPPRASPNSQPKWEVFRRPFLRPRFLSGVRAGPALFRPHLCGAEAVAVVTVTVTVALAVAMAAGARGPSSRGYAQQRSRCAVERGDVRVCRWLRVPGDGHTARLAATQR